ncbi:MAG TPA: hypothetical protein VGM90_41020 [Kofleriaceae bacterium]|jgi:hypothetical protein
MWRVLLIFAVVLMAGDATGLIPEADEVACADEANGKQCPPSCPSCTCAWHSMTPAPVAGIELATIVRATRAVDLPELRAQHGRLAPDLVHRPPIA